MRKSAADFLSAAVFVWMEAGSAGRQCVLGWCIIVTPLGVLSVVLL